jgi:hypothetical protein
MEATTLPVRELVSTCWSDFRRGRSAEAIFEAYPSLGSLVKVYGAITFILEHPDEVEAVAGRPEPGL